MQGYISYPTLCGTDAFFICEGDLWQISLQDPLPHAIRLTGANGELSHAAVNADATKVAFSATEEGMTEVWVFDLKEGGPLKRLTFDDANAHVVGWDGQDVIFASDRGQPFRRLMTLWRIQSGGDGRPAPLELGDASSLSIEPAQGRRVLCRHREDLAYWKRYQGGRAGQLWVEEPGGAWSRLLPDQTYGLASPVWQQGRIWFLSDMEDHANVYSVRPDGSDLKRHTHHEGFAARHLQGDGKRLVYVCGGDLWVFDPERDQAQRVDVKILSSASRLGRRFVDAQDYIEDYNLHPKGHSLSVTARGKAFCFYLWEGGVRQVGELEGVRHRFGCYLPQSGEVIYVVGDGAPEERLVVASPEAGVMLEVAWKEGERERLGQVELIWPHPKKRMLAFANHRYELGLVDLDQGEVHLLDVSPALPIEDASWSACGGWLAWSRPETLLRATIMLFEEASDEVHAITHGEFLDTLPCFDPEGRYLYFASSCNFDPSWADQYHEMQMLRSQRLALITLREDVADPFVLVPKSLGEEDEDEDDFDEEEDASESSSSEEDSDASSSSKGDHDEEDAEPIQIDLEGITERVILFPTSPGRIGQIEANEERVFYIRLPIQSSHRGPDDEERGSLFMWSLKRQKAKRFLPQTSSFELSHDRKTIAVWTEDSLRVLSANDPPPDDQDEPEDAPASRENGWIDLERLSVSVEVRQEWRQMLREIWRLMRDHFWSKDMSGVDWEEVYTRFSPLVDRVRTRSEFSDLVNCMQGELGTSHAYEFGGDYKPTPRYPLGYLGATFEWEQGVYAWRIKERYQGDSWSKKASSPLGRPGVQVPNGHLIQAINGRRLTAKFGPEQALVNQGGQQVILDLLNRETKEVTSISVETLMNERPLVYRDWVRRQREWVRQRSEGRLGYMHLPNMGEMGYAEFHRAFAKEAFLGGMVVDVRYNEGGNVSSLLIEKLARVVVGYSFNRHGEPVTYPQDAPRGPLVLVTNAYAGSDGDIFSHMFKRLGLGKTFGERTWGGVVGIWPKHTLVDGSMTTQPEFATWVDDVGFELENWGMVPDVEVDVPPGPGLHDPEGDEVLNQAITWLLSESKGRQGAPDLVSKARLVRRHPRKLGES